MQPGRLDVVVVLGGGVTETAETGETLLSQASASRLLRAVQVFRESGAAHLLCAGKGIGRTSEGEVMAAAAERLGVPREKILVDSLSENTRGHAVEMDRRFADKTIRIGLVTSAYHLKRSETELRSYFPNVSPFPSDYLYSHPKGPAIPAFVPNAGSLFKSAVALHEMAGHALVPVETIMKILCLNPPFKTEHGRFSRTSRSPAVTKSGTIYYPIWLCYAAGVLEDAGFDVKVIDSCADE